MRTTADIYTHFAFDDQADAVASLPEIGDSAIPTAGSRVFAGVRRLAESNRWKVPVDTDRAIRCRHV
jgi:hypothetical protein